MNPRRTWSVSTAARAGGRVHFPTGGPVGPGEAGRVHCVAVAACAPLSRELCLQSLPDGDCCVLGCVSSFTAALDNPE